MENDPWKGLQIGDAKRVESKGRHDFFWVRLEKDLPGLMLEFSDVVDPRPKLPTLASLEIDFRSLEKGVALVFGLKEKKPDQIEVFRAFCRNIVSSGEAAPDERLALLEVVRQANRWHYLLRSGSSRGLSVEEQRGLIGELAFLQELVGCLGPQKAIEAWKGPLGAPKDFELLHGCVEIKTRRSASKPFVSISSEFQLSDVHDARLFLRVTEVSSSVSPSGTSLHDLVNETARLFQTDPHVVNLWDQSLIASGYDANDKYDDRNWKIGDSMDFEITEGFPRVVPPLPFGVSNIKYSLSLDACREFAVADLFGKIARMENNVGAS